MIVAAYRDAKARADALAAEQLGPLAGGWRSAAGRRRSRAAGSGPDGSARTEGSRCTKASSRT